MQPGHHLLVQGGKVVGNQFVDMFYHEISRACGFMWGCRRGHYPSGASAHATDRGAAIQLLLGHLRGVGRFRTIAALRRPTSDSLAQLSNLSWLPWIPWLDTGMSGAGLPE